TEGNVNISVFDAAGRSVSTLVNETKPAGEYTFTLNNQNLAAGIYFVRVQTPDGLNTQTMTIIR
ncbi:MAG: T9SS type A sorting domain-containing protein, partial [bacterium]